jgi:uncharacterized protein
MKFGLKQETIDKINAVFKNHSEVESAIIYGSRAKGNYRIGSDIDLTLNGGYLTSEVLSKINTEIDDLNTPYLFDISIFHKLKSPDLEEHINRVGLEFYKSK